MRVLIVDDSNTARIMCKRALPPSLLEGLLEASGGQQALDLCRAEKIDLMFLDLTMPGVDGYQVLEALQKDGASQPKVVVMSADIQLEALARIKKLGAIGFLAKPANLPKLEKLLRDRGLL
jgi:two-component system, chemotaxis family, chemotaxis protein CheY